MNFLYGRFGIKVSDNNTKIVNQLEEIKLLALKDLNTKPIKVINDNISIISYENTKPRYDLLYRY